MRSPLAVAMRHVFYLLGHISMTLDSRGGGGEACGLGREGHLLAVVQDTCSQS